MSIITLDEVEVGATTATAAVLRDTPSTSFFTDETPAAPIHRLSNRVFIDGGNSYAGSRSKTDGATFIGDPAQDFNSFYLERSASFIALSSGGGVGGLFGTQTSARYDGVTIWAAGQSITSGDRRGYAGRFYSASTTGTTGATPPTHTTGSVSDGGVTWAFDDYAYVSPIGLAFGCLNDVAADSDGAWGAYGEIVRSDGAGTSFLMELAVKNLGGDVSVTPYDILPAGATIGLWMAGGGDGALGAAENPSSAAFVIGKNSHTWNAGIVFQSTALTGTDGATAGSGEGVAVLMGMNHSLIWNTPSDTVGARITSNVDTNGSRVGITFLNNAIQFRRASGLIGQIEHGAGGSATANYLRFASAAAGSGVQVIADGSDTNVDLKLVPKGTGVVLLADTHDLVWNTSGGTVGARISSDVATNSDRVGITFADNIVQFRRAGGIIGTVEHGAGGSATANYPRLASAAAGSGVQLTVQGTDTDIDILLVPKNAGAVRFGTHASLSGESVTGYITVKDAGGTTRKLAVVS